MDGLIDLTVPTQPDLTASSDPEPLPAVGLSLLSPPPNLLNGGNLSAVPQPMPAMPQPQERFEDTIRDFADVDKTRANIYARVLAAAQKMQPVSNARHTLRLVDVDYQDPDKVSLQEQKQAILGRMSRGRRLRGTWELLDNATGEVLDRKKSVLMSVPHMTERGTFIHNGSEYTLKNQQRLRPGVFTRVKDNGEIETHVNVMPGKGVSHRYYLDPDKSVFKLKVGQGTVGLMPLLKTMGATAEQLKEAWGPEVFAANYNADNASEYTKLQSKFLTEAEMQETPDIRSKLLRQKFEKTELDPEVTRTTLGGDYSNLNLDALLAISKKLISVSRGESDPDDRDSLAYQQFFGPEDLIAERLERDKGNLRRQLLWRASAKGNLRSMPSSALSSQVEAALLTSGLGQCFDDQTWVLTKRGFVRWSEVKDTDLFACRIDGKLTYRRATRVIREHYEGEMIGCRTKVFSYLVTPNHRCYYRSFQRKGRPQAEYKVATAEALFGKTRCHLTTLVTTLSDRESVSSPDTFTLRWYHDKYKREIEQSVPVELWAEYLGWWLAEGSAFVDGTQYKSVIAQTRAVNPAECDAIESLLSSLPFNWRLGSNGTDYIIVNKGLCLELRSYGTKKSKRIPRYVFDWPVPLLRKLFDAYMLGDGNDDQGYLKSETVSLGLAHDLVELWGLLGGTAQISPHNTPAGVYWVVSYSDAVDRYVASSTDAAKHGYDPHFRTYYDGMIYCAEVPGNLLYVMRDGKPHWSHNSIEEINPAELLDKLTAVTRMGEGGIASTDAIPRESRSVQPSMFGYMDPVRTPESGRVGVDNYFARNAKKGRDGKLYAAFQDTRTGQIVHKTPQEVAGLTVGFPGSLSRTAPRVTAMRGGKMVMVPKDEIDCTLPNMEDAFNPLTNMVPMKSTVKGQRTVMASRMLTQALPVENAEAPLVQSAVPGTDGQKSFEELYANTFGAVRAKAGGVVQSVSGDAITIRYDDGTTDTKELYNNFPFNRKTSLSQTPLVQPGQRVDADSLLAKSNFTDPSGTVALGKNARTAYMSWEGKNFEDAIVISQSFADKMKSEHIYQHDLDVDAKTRTGKKAFVSLFPSEYSRKVLDKFDPTGVIRVGEKVEYGDPLILAAKEKETAYNKVHKRGQAGHSNSSVTWDHHDPGVVTDVVMGKDGPSVVVKTYSPTRVGDKVSGRYGDKGVVADVIPDHRMPQGSDGKPFELLLNPAGIITRCYDEQTEFLTSRGWVYGKDVTSQDLFVCYHSWSGGLHVLPQLLPFHAAPYSGKMVKYQNKMLDFCVTPNHRFLAACGYPGAAYQEVTADRLFGTNSWRVPVTGQPVPGCDSDFTLPQITRNLKDTQSDTSDIRIDAGDWAEFLGWYMAEGNADAKVHISQSDTVNPENCERIAALLERLPFAWNYNKKNTQFHLTSKRLCTYLQPFGLCRDKFIPDWLFTQSVATRQRFLEAYLAGDGNKDQTSRPEHDYWGAGTMSERLASDLQRLFVYQGMSANVSKQGCGLWRVGIHAMKHRLMTRTGWSEVDYNGWIYCPTVPTGYVVTRRNGKILIAGNTNPSQMIELALGKLAAKQGKPIKVPDFDDSKDMSQWAADMLAQAGLGDTEDVLDPSRDQYVRGIATGNRFFMKLHHTAEGKGQSRGGGGYTAEETPAKGGESGSKRIGVLETNALLSHGAVSTLQDIKNIRGQKNDDYWLQFMAGYNPTVTKVPFVYRKFVNQLKAAGVNVVKSGTQTNIMAMTDKDVDELAGDRDLTDSSGVDWEKGLKELRGGLFDKAMTGGHGGDRWSAIRLTEPLPNPVMEEPLRHMLRLTGKQFRGVLSGEHSIGSFGTGPMAMKKALEAINLPKEIENTRAIISGGRKSERDAAIRRLGYLKSAQKLGLHPADYMMKRVPVLPPTFRPVSLMSNDMPLVADANVLYKELLEANKNWDALQKEVGSDGVGSDRLVVYDAFKAVTGLGDPITQKSKDRNVKGLLRSVFGTSPKYGTVQRKLISTTVDNVGRAVITPNPDLDMDTVGLPEDKAYNAYEKFVTRRLVRQGMNMSQALEAIKERKPVAQKALLEEMENRPVYISRAPVLHKFGIMAFKPVLTKSDTLQVSPLIVKGFNADFDGDTMNYHVPSSDAAREEALTRMLPSKNIFSVADMRSVVHAPANEYVGGLYHATSAKNEDRPKKIFQTIADMRKAYARGDVLAGDRVQILEKK